ncbi:AfsR/SARP family transcriptional regulator [Plantactinospora sonchi]|uniref:BTAD domain-containing putative transcriptional regulator n=1 Tax=Plantactinospora sonchi TaxID=1544735 RepID=A0ABU7RS77_9ACTN
MEFGILGPVEVRHDGRLLPGGSGRERLVLAGLLLDGDRLVPAETLVDRLWQRPPGSARAQLHNLISALRARFRDVDPGLIETRPTGYVLRLRAHRLDLNEFRGLADRGRVAAEAGDHTAAVALLDQALALWRGPALADVVGVHSGRLRDALHRERLAAVEARLDALLGLGDHGTVLREVELLLADDPYAERLYCRQMLALAGLGRRGDALGVYRQAYRRFADGLGLEPGPLLRATQQRILLGEESVTGAAPVQATRPVPRQLPPAPRLTGRETLVERILGRMSGAGSTSVPVLLLVGPGGVGKSGLALAAGHRLSTVFPDGQLYADLRGSHDPPGDPYQIVERFLRALGVAGGDIPDDPEERVTLYRSHLARGRMLVVLDDAVDETQIRPLLPGAPGGGALVTSRRQLAAMLDAVRVPVPALSASDALRLLADRAGEVRIDAEPEAAREVVRLCGGLPLAVCVAAARLAVRPEEAVEELRRRLAAERGRLDELAVGDLDVRASLSLSYRALSDEARRLLRRLGSFGTADWPQWVASALLDRADGPARMLLHQLADVHLVEPLGRDAVGQQRYRLHDLVAEYARERNTVDDQPAERGAAVERLLSGWLALAGEADQRLATPEPPEASPPSGDGQRALRVDPRAWFETERAGLLAAVDQAVRADLPDLAGRLALAVSGFLRIRSYAADWEHTLRLVLAGLPDETADPLLRGRLLGELFAACLGRDRYAALPAIAADQLALTRQVDNPELLVHAFGNAGVAALRTGQPRQAYDWMAQAVEAARHPELPGQLLRNTLGTLGFVHWEAGEPERAVPLLAEALSVGDDPAHPLRTAMHRYHYGLALTDVGELVPAREALTEAMAVSAQMGDDLGTAYVEQALADVEIRAGRLPEATRLLERALTGHEAIGHSDGLAETLRAIGDLAAAEGRWADAGTSLRRALELWRGIGSRHQVIRVLARLERVGTALGDDDAAGTYRAERRSILDELGLDEAALQLPPCYLAAKGSPASE